MRNMPSLLRPSRPSVIQKRRSSKSFWWSWGMSSSLPIGWKLEPLGQLAQVVSGGTPSRHVPEFWRDGTIPWVTPTDITNTGGRYLSESCEGITELGLQSCSAKKLPSGALLMTSRATLGEVRIALREVCTNQGFKSLIPFKGVN